LKNNDVIIEGYQKLLDHETDFYKKLTGQSERVVVKPDFDFPYYASAKENERLVMEFS
jgi:hypothetical protein